MRFACPIAIVLVACGGASIAPLTTTNATPPPIEVDASAPEPAPLDDLIPGFRITNYTLAQESELSGKRSGNHTRVTAHGLTGDYAWEFLCSNRGVAMQGTGITRDGKLVRYVTGGGGFCGHDHHLCDCKNARFSPATSIVGSTGRELIENFSIAVDPNVIPYGSFVWIDAMKRWFRADDTGGAIIGRHIDVFVGTKPFVFNGETSVFVTSAPQKPDDPGPTGTNATCAREALVCGEGAMNRMLFRCHDGRATFARVCAGGCRHGMGNADDACLPRPPTPYCSDDGWYCGGDRVDGNPNTLYHCNDHALLFETTCERGCAIDPDSIADACY